MASKWYEKAYGSSTSYTSAKPQAPPGRPVEGPHKIYSGFVEPSPVQDKQSTAKPSINSNINRSYPNTPPPKIMNPRTEIKPPSILNPPTNIVVHKEDGKARYGWQQQDGIWVKKYD